MNSPPVFTDKRFPVTRLKDAQFHRDAEELMTRLRAAGITEKMEVRSHGTTGLLLIETAKGPIGFDFSPDEVKNVDIAMVRAFVKNPFSLEQAGNIVEAMEKANTV